MQAMQVKFGEAARTVSEISEVPKGSNVVDSQWLSKWKGDGYGVV